MVGLDRKVIRDFAHGKGGDTRENLGQGALVLGIEVLHESVTWKHSSNGRYVSVRIAFRADSREQYDAAHAALRAHPEVKWTL